MKSMSIYHLLLTGTIDSSVFHNTGNKITDVEERLRQYESSITRYITESVFDIIVFAENSGFPFDSARFESLARKYQKRFEYLKCESDVENTIRYGKSYGEAKLIEDALQKSRLLEGASVIYKATGRIFLKNSNAIVKTRDRHRNEFLVYECRRWCFTNLFKFTKEDYLLYWKDVKEKCNEPGGTNVEEAFFEILEDAVSRHHLDVGSFSTWPDFTGIQGWTLEPYTGSRVEWIVRSLMAKMKCFTYGSFASQHLKF